MSTTKIICKKHNLLRNHVIVKKLEAGIILHGWEVKSIRQYSIQINKSYISLKNNKLVLINSIITPIKTICKNTSVNKKRQRFLLLHKEEIKNIEKYKKINGNGITLIPTEIYFKKNKIKISVSVVKHNKEYNKKNLDQRKTWLMEKKFITC